MIGYGFTYTFFKTVDNFIKIFISYNFIISV